MNRRSTVFGVACRSILSAFRPMWACLSLDKHPSSVVRLAVMLAAVTVRASIAGAAGPDVSPQGEVEIVQFSESAPYASDAQFKRRLGFTVDGLQYDIRQEKFRLIIPAAYSTNQSWGLLVWVSPSDDARIPPAMTKELAQHRLLFAGALHSGNQRHPLDRCRLALDATCNVCRGFRVHPDRILVGGFSGGGRVASILGVCYSDIFSGTLALCGVDFYQPVPAAKGGFYPATYLPEKSLLTRALQHGRFALVTGQFDLNRDNTKSTADHGFRAAGFKNVLYLEVPGMSHSIPEGTALNSAFDYLLPSLKPALAPPAN